MYSLSNTKRCMIDIIGLSTIFVALLFAATSAFARVDTEKMLTMFWRGHAATGDVVFNGEPITFGGDADVRW